MKAPTTLDEFYRTFDRAALRGDPAPCALARRVSVSALRGAQGAPAPGSRAVAVREPSLTGLAHGTPFHGTRVPLRTWFLAMFFVGRHKQGISVQQFQRDAASAAIRHLQRYLERVHLPPRRWREGELFGFVLRRVARGQPLPYRHLVAEGTA